MEHNEKNRALVERLCAQLSLSKEPFISSSAHFFSGGQRQHILEIMRHMAIFGDQVLLLTGARGSGKSKIVEEFIRRHAEEIEIVSISASVNPAGGASIARFAALSDLPEVEGEAYPEMLQRLIQHFDQQMQSHGRRTLLILDDADVLTRDELGLYVKVFRDLPAETSTVLMLVGSAGLLDLLTGGPQAAPADWFHQIQIKPFSDEDVLAYLQSWLVECGFSEQLFISERQLADLQALAQGLPGRINREFPGVFLGESATVPKLENKAVKAMSLRRIVGGAAGLLLLSFVWVAYQYGWLGEPEVPQPVADLSVRPASEESAEPESSEVLNQQVAARLQAIDEAIDRVAEAPLADSAEGVAVADPTSTETARDERTEPAPNAGAVVPVEKGSVAATAAETLPVAAPEKQVPATLPSPKVPPVAVKPSSEPIKASQESAPSVLKPASATASVKEQAPVKQPATAVQPALPKPAPVVASAAPAKSPAQTATKPAESNATKRSAEWVRQQNPRHYTAQVLGTRTEASAKNYAQLLAQSATPVFYIETRYQGQPWFVVLYGHYADRAQATAALKSAPKEVQNQQPWLRSYDGIRASLP